MRTNESCHDSSERELIPIYMLFKRVKNYQQICWKSSLLKLNGLTFRVLTAITGADPGLPREEHQPQRTGRQPIIRPNLLKTAIKWRKLDRGHASKILDPPLQCKQENLETRMHSSRMCTVHCSGCLSCHACPALPAMHTPPAMHASTCHACPLPCTPFYACTPTMHTSPCMPPAMHALHHACPATMHAPTQPPCHAYLPCHAYALCHACVPLPRTLALHHACTPLPCMPPPLCHTCPPLPCMFPLCHSTPSPLSVDRILDMWFLLSCFWVWVCHLFLRPLPERQFSRPLPGSGLW